MPYSTKYNKEKHGIAEEYILKYDKFIKNKPLLIDGISPEKAKRLLWIFHDYLHVTGCTSRYSVRQVERHILLSRKKQSFPKNISLEAVSLGAKEGSFTKQFTLLMKELLSSPSPNEVICRLVRDPGVSKGTLSALLSEYSRVVES